MLDKSSCKRVNALLPIAKNSLHGVIALSDFALICAWTGERELALEQLEALTAMPGEPSSELRLNPRWDPLGGDPRFDKIVNFLAPSNLCILPTAP
jgi:hypothetical protein